MKAITQMLKLYLSFEEIVCITLHNNKKEIGNII